MRTKLNISSLFTKKIKYYYQSKGQNLILKSHSPLENCKNKSIPNKRGSNSVQKPPRHLPHIEDKSSTKTTDCEDGCSSCTSSSQKQHMVNPEKYTSTSGQKSLIGLDEVVRKQKEKGTLTSNVVRIEAPCGKQIEQVYDGVHTGPVLGTGISGVVRLITHSRTGIKYAVKCVDLGLIEDKKSIEQIKQEISIMSELDHPLITRLVEVYETSNEIYLVQDLCSGGELFDRLDEQPDYHYTEQQCAFLVKQMLSAIRYIHSKGVTHRDLKLENFLFSTKENDSHLKLIDFGLSKYFSPGELLHDRVGTPYTVAPEVLEGSYDERCDLWAIGVITYLLLSGEAPFGGCGGPEPLSVVRDSILQGKFTFEPEEIWSNVSQNAKDFIKSLLMTDPKKRPTACEAQMSPWLKQWFVQDKMTEGKNKLNPNIIKAMTSCTKQNSLRRIMNEVLSFSLAPEQVQDLYLEFEKIDTDGSGMISLEELKKTLIASKSGSKRRLKEKDVVDIFHAMQIWNSEKHVEWHEFIAAVLSHKIIDESNISLTFERLDSGHKGYITFDDILDLIGSNGRKKENHYRKLFMKEISDLNCKNDRILFKDFLLMMNVE